MKFAMIGAWGAMVASGAAGFAAAPARAEVLVSGLGRTVCATVYNNRLQLDRCNGGDAQNWFGGYGQQHYHNLCLDSETPQPGAQLVVAVCQNKPSQRWGLQTNGLMRNESGWCADLNGGSVNEGTRIQTWTCSANPASSRHQLWAMGSMVPAASLGINASVSNAVPAGALISNVSILRSAHVGAGGAVINPNGSNIVAAGGGNVVAAGGGNVVAAGGGNVVAAGGGNFIQLNGGAMTSN